MTKYKITVIPGDGIGPEVTESACEVLKAVGRKSGHAFAFTEVAAGGAAIDSCGMPLPKETLRLAKESDAVLLGAVGGPKWDNLPGDARPGSPKGQTGPSSAPPRSRPGVRQRCRFPNAPRVR